MKSSLLALLLFAAGQALALQVEVTCYPKAFSCNGPYCQWQTVPMPVTQALFLNQDPNFPNAQHPYEVWQTRFLTQYDQHYLTLDIVYSNQDLLHPLKIYANLNARTVMAETSGQEQIDIGLRNANYGRGFICNNFRVFP